MWKYVGQRLRDSAEQTCSHIKNLRSTFSTCNTDTIQENSNKKSCKRYELYRDGQVFNIWLCFDKDEAQNKQKKNSFDIDAPYIIQKCYENHKQKQQDAFNGWRDTSFLQWVCECNFKCFPSNFLIIFLNIHYFISDGRCSGQFVFQSDDVLLFATSSESEAMASHGTANDSTITSTIAR